MRLTTVTRATDHRLARDLPAAAGRVPLLRAGALITERVVKALTGHGIHAVWVEDELSDGIEPEELLTESVRAETATRVNAALTVARQAFGSGERLPPGVLSDLARIAQAIATQISDSPSAALVLGDLASADEYTHRHSVNVTALGLMLGRELYRRNGWIDYRGERRFDRIDQQLTTLGMGLLLHDVGKMAVPGEILLKPGKLTPDEWAIMRAHPQSGVELLRGDEISPLVKSIVRDHHERWDGLGYLRGISEGRITQHARIAAVADVYDAASSNRPYKEAMPAHQAVEIIADGAGTAFDPEVVSIFLRVVFPYPLGTEVELPDGRAGVVVQVDPDSPKTPLVRAACPGGWDQLTVDLRAG